MDLEHPLKKSIAPFSFLMKIALRRTCLATFLAILLLFMMSRLINRNTLRATPVPPVLVSLSTTISRVEFELGITLHSLLSQTIDTRIRVNIPEDEEIEFSVFMNKTPDSLLHNPRVSLVTSFDYGPATKFIPVVEMLKERGKQKIVICDDDHHYSSSVVETLVEQHTADPTNAYGLRGIYIPHFHNQSGWRIRSDFTWGVGGSEFDFHVHEGWQIRYPYQVGVLTANECYIIDASWFKNYTISDYSNAPAGAALVDDIMMSGHLATLGIKRFIVPIDIISPHLAKTNTLDKKMKSKGISRAHANDVTLGWFKDEFKKEGIPYVFGGFEQPKMRSWVMRKVFVPVRCWLTFFNLMF